MRYFIVTYAQRANGQMDELTAVSTRVKNKDWQMANVILDFKELKVLRSSLNGEVVPKDWDRIVSYYHQHYKNIIERLFRENGYEVVQPDNSDESTPVQTSDTPTDSEPA